MTAKVTFSNPDEILGAIVRALAVQSAGFQAVGGMNKKYLQDNGYYRFEFSQSQFERFKTLINDYVPSALRETLQISSIPS